MQCMCICVCDLHRGCVLDTRVRLSQGVHPEGHFPVWGWHWCRAVLKAMCVWRKGHALAHDAATQALPAQQPAVQHMAHTTHTHTQACRSLDSSSTINCESGTAVHLLRLVCHTETQYMTPPQGLHTHSTLVVCGVWGPARCRCSCSSSSGEKQLVPENLKADVLHCCACSWLPLLPDLPARLSVCLPVCLSASHVYWGALNGL